MKCFLPIILFVLFAISAYSQTASVIAENANLRGTPSEQGKVIDTLPNGKIGTVLMQKEAWYLLQTDDYVGWIHGNTIKLTDSTLVIDGYEPTAPKTLKSTPAKSTTKSTPSESRTYIRGERGGCYYINASGKKTYVDRNLCN